MTEYLDPDDNPPAIISLENYTFLTRTSAPLNIPVFGTLHKSILLGFSNAR